MGVKNADHVTKEKARKTLNVPLTSGDYAEETIIFGSAGTGDAEQSFMGVTALLESAPAGSSLEFWMPRVTDGAILAESRALGDYYFSGKAILPANVADSRTGQTTSFGSETWSLAGYPGAMLRARSGGVSGAMVVSASAF